MLEGDTSWSNYVLEDGTLGGDHVLERQVVYKGRSGANVERFWDHERSYIYKPIANVSTIGRELWAQDKLLPHLEGFRVPLIYAASKPGAKGQSWLIYEDLGSLQHNKSAAELIEAAGWIAQWHRLPIGLIPEAYNGHTPYYAEIWEGLKTNTPAQIAMWLNVESATVNKWFMSMRAGDAASRIVECEVVSHGDYHRFNIAKHGGEKVVLDWEYAHRNHVYWDLYSLLDITSYRYTKAPLSQEERITALRNYWDARHAAATNEDNEWRECSDVGQSFDQFCEGYWLYASIYSAWIAGLIHGDLARGEVAPEQLLKQQQETSDVFIDCLLGLKMI
jgi:hypothetical protein